MSESIFRAEGERFMPSEHARGPWDPQALHGGAPAALIAAAFERSQPDVQQRFARLSFEFLRPIPFAELELSTRTVRTGRRVQELAGELRADGETVCRASALCVREVPAGLPPSEPAAAPNAPAMPGPEAGKEARFALDDPSATSFATTGMEMRWLSDPWALGPGRVWMRLRHPLLPDDPLSPLARLVATADFGNGVSAALPFDRFIFINADLSIHLWRAPQGEWIGLDAHTLLHSGGAGTAESVLHDEHGPVGRAFQALVVQPR